MRSIRILIATSILGISSLVSFAASGELDRSFGTGQNGMTHFDTPYPISALAVLPDDRFIGGDQCSQIGFGSHFCMIRYTVDGAIDTTFGAYGTVFTQMASVGNESSTIVKLLVQSDGKIIAGGYTQRTVGSNTYNYIAVARYFPDGTLDTTFADQGKFFNLGTAVPTGMRLVDMALRPDGKLVILAGWPSITASGSRVVLLRLNASGALDSTFGTGGRVARDYGSLSDYAGSIALGPDGKIVVGSQGTSEIRFVFEKYLSNADYDVSAGQNGRISFYGGTSSLVRRVRILPDGSTIALGNSFNFAHPTMMITRLKPDLSFDASFAGTGLLFTNLAANNSCEGIDFQPRSDGRITLMANCSISSSTFFGASQEVARLRQDGSLDPQFGVGGRIVKLYRTYTGNSIVQSTGKIVVCGRTTQQSGPLPGAFC